MIKLFIILNLLTMQLYAQSTDKNNTTTKSAVDTVTRENGKGDSNWHDTTYKQIALLKDFDNQKIIEYTFGKNATIYFSFSEVQNCCQQGIAEIECRKKEYSAFYRKINSISAKKDTIKINDIDETFDFVIDDLLKKGHARVFDKTRRCFADTISQRLEKYGLYAYRFFYLPGRKPFFSNEEYSGILENDVYFSSPDDLRRLYDKIIETGK